MNINDNILIPEQDPFFYVSRETRDMLNKIK